VSHAKCRSAAAFRLRDAQGRPCVQAMDEPTHQRGCPPPSLRGSVCGSHQPRPFDDGRRVPTSGTLCGQARRIHLGRWFSVSAPPRPFDRRLGRGRLRLRPAPASITLVCPGSRLSLTRHDEARLACGPSLLRRIPSWRGARAAESDSLLTRSPKGSGTNRRTREFPARHNETRADGFGLENIGQI
jgi:hypothetical protein